mmetsp:Transcript_40250/g.121255  ORF Transcript_40250/g.121255 Transcript_40250/m.121255 type:complete len:259 (-) Transcript_40250:446-1222(-)
MSFPPPIRPLLRRFRRHGLRGDVSPSTAPDPIAASRPPAQRPRLRHSAEAPSRWESHLAAVPLRGARLLWPMPGSAPLRFVEQGADGTAERRCADPVRSRTRAISTIHSSCYSNCGDDGGGLCHEPIQNPSRRGFEPHHPRFVGPSRSALPNVVGSIPRHPPLHHDDGSDGRSDRGPDGGPDQRLRDDAAQEGDHHPTPGAMSLLSRARPGNDRHREGPGGSRRFVPRAILWQRRGDDANGLRHEQIHFVDSHDRSSA